MEKFWSGVRGSAKDRDVQTLPCALEVTSTKCLCFPTKRSLTQMENKLIDEDPLGQDKLVRSKLLCKIYM